jgi:uncharacterized membrane protein YhfC
MNTDTVSSDQLLAMFVTLGIAFLLPALLWILAMRKEKRMSSAVIAGAFGFIVPQMLIRLPILQWLGAQNSWILFISTNRLFVLLFFPLTAALFETAGRLVVLGKVLRSRLSYHTAYGAGIGHGGAEAIGLIGLTYINNIVISFMINSGRLPDVAGMDATVRALTQTAPSLFLMAGLERALVIPLHIALSVLLGLYVSRNRLLLGAVLCVAIHFAVDFGAVYLQMQQVSFWLIEGFLLIVAICSIWLILFLRKRFILRDIPKDEAEAALDEGY